MTDTPTVQEALDLLLAGNQRFIAGAAEHPNQDAARRAELAESQRPFAVLLGCSDSRLAAEILFDRGLGDLFVVRTAGQVLGDEVLGSIEYGVDVLGCRLIVVLGHQGCGAVAAATALLDGGSVPGGYVRDLVEHVAPSVLTARAAGRSSPDEVLAEHVSRTADLLLERSRSLSQQVEAGTVGVVGFCYQLDDGTVDLVAERGLARTPSIG
ncbi:carbonic anhydrase [Microlunatus soli]|uniref:carbonic anhydrase n=1 Tax=Microlunatus soli TaxID=630515 RepID=A0A1H1NAM3_9ACTN|nr:carbonic anhydrase [Microlunatus soli]SDR96003.1 carbonic anhydrase [Microlunatus soli]